MIPTREVALSFGDRRLSGGRIPPIIFNVLGRLTGDNTGFVTTSEEDDEGSVVEVIDDYVEEEGAPHNDSDIRVVLT